MNCMKPLHSKAAQLELNQVLDDEHQIQFIKMDAPIPVEDLLNFLLKLNASLELEHIIKTIVQTINEHTVIDHFEYSNDVIGSYLVVGDKQANQFTYTIIDENNEHLGEVIISRKTTLSQQDIDIIESLLCYAMFAVRNHLKYEYAKQSSLTDPLTDLGNRRALLKTLNHERELAKRNNQPFSVLALDIDNFKTINDCYGHEVGDLLLKQISKRFKKATREYDELFRLGGDEFVVVLNQADAETALHVAYRVLKSIGQKTFRIKDHELSVTMSIGVAIYTAGDDTSALLDRADQALYRAKNQGKNCIRT